MRISVICFGLLLLGCTLAPAQQKTQEEIDREKRLQEEASKVNKDTASFEGWKHAAAMGLNLSQVSFKDWVAGGENSFSYSAWLQGASGLVRKTYLWNNSYKLAIGHTKLGGQEPHKSDDEIRLETVLIYRLGTVINPYAAATLRTQFAAGYVYDASGARQVSKFFDPAYLMQSAGVAYQPVPGLTTRLGAGVREVLTSAFPAYADDPSTPAIEHTRVTGGMESVTDFATSLDDNLTLNARLELFAPFKTMDRIIVRNDYAITAKVSKYVATNLTVNILNDVNISARTQIKQALSLGFSYLLL
jgi:hypothetical protein